MTPRLTRDIIRSENLKSCKGEQVRLRSQLKEDESEAAWQKAVTDPEALIALDLFCGAGGLSYGFQQAGFAVAAGIDRDRDSCETHAANFLSKTLCRDIQSIMDPRTLLEELGIPRVDVIIGGPPCQGFSIASRAQVRSMSNELRKEIDAKNYLYRQFVRFVRVFKPLFFVMENVPHLNSFSDELNTKAIRADFNAGEYDGEHYCVYPGVLDAVNFGVPQFRRRLFFVGTRLGWVFRWPRLTCRYGPPHRLSKCCPILLERVLT